MRTRAIVIALTALCVLSFAYRVRSRSQGQSQAGSSISNGAGAPSGSCSNGSVYIDSNTGYIWSCSGSAWVQRTGLQPLHGTTGTITGTLLALGGCDTGTAAVTGATPGQVARASTTDGVPIGGMFDIQADVTSSGIVTVNVCAKAAGTPASKSYNVVVHP